jgi:hypothetical protein
MLQRRPLDAGFGLWLIWNVVAVALLYAKPWGPFGWDELAVCVSGLAWVLAGEPSGGGSELVCLGSILVVSILIGDAARRAEAERNAQKPVGTLLEDAADIFLFVLGRELSRARRHDSAFAVLSVDQHSSNPGLSLDSLAELLANELHAYADTVSVDDRVLALVPEVSTEGKHFLLRRLTSKAETALGGKIRIGLAHYPQDAMFAEDLIELADRKRRDWSATPMEGTGCTVEDTAASS